MSAAEDLADEKHRENFRALWADLGPKMAAKNVGRDKEAEDLFMLGWAIGVQNGIKAGIDEATALVHEIRQGRSVPQEED